MESIEKKKGNTGLIVLVVILILIIIGLSGYIYYDNNSCNVNNENDSTTTNNQKIDDNNSQANNENDYSIFVKKMIEQRKNNEVKGSDNSVQVTEYMENVSNSMMPDLDGYTIGLLKNGDLIVNDETKIDTNVLFYRVVSIGNGGYQSLCYVKENGKAYCADVESMLYMKEKLSIKEILHTSNIVNIIPASVSDEVRDSNGNIQGASGYRTPLFIDINGNTHKYDIIVN